MNPQSNILMELQEAAELPHFVADSNEDNSIARYPRRDGRQ
jgi:hypothetical protein